MIIATGALGPISSAHHSMKRKVLICSLQLILIVLTTAVVCVYTGFVLGLHFCQECLNKSSLATVQHSIQEAKLDIPHAQQQQQNVVNNQQRNAQTHNDESSFSHPLVIPNRMSKLFAGMARVNRDLFAKQFDIGVPLVATEAGNQDVLILYSNDKALPDQFDKYSEPIPELNVKSATKHCNTLKVVLTDSHQRNQCLAIMGQWESYHVHRFARFPLDRKGKVDPEFPLRYVSRVPGEDGNVIEKPASFDTKLWDKMIVEYLTNFDTILQQLKPIAANVAKNNTIVVMVCNLGQSELLMNFACSAQSRGLDVSQVLVFATDLETKTIAEGLGLAAFYDELNYAAISEHAARTYGDRTFSRLMLAKLYCVHMINALGYDVLFQDVDVVWYRNPVDYFVGENNTEFHLYFQQDGSESRRYAPYSPNTGFYFVRHNSKTEYFLHSLLMAGNLIVGSGSHQSALNTVLQEHVSWRGLRAKIIPKETTMFPGGFHFHRRKQFIKDVLNDEVKPYIFHMSWTTNKENKKKFFEQMGDWFVHDHCIGKNTTSILNGTVLESDAIDLAIANVCCMAKAHVKCHYRDKPSRIPCRDSPPIDDGRQSWW